MISQRGARPYRMLGRRRVAALALATLTASGCSNGDAEPSPDAFCATARQNPELITDPPLSTPAEIEQSIEFYRLMGQLAPIEIAPEWNQLVHAMETANELVPDKPESEQLVAQTAFASELAAVRVKEWMSLRCGIDLPITTIVSHDGAVASVPADSAGSGGPDGSTITDSSPVSTAPQPSNPAASTGSVETTAAP